MPTSLGKPNSQVWDFAGHSEKLAGWMLNLDGVEAQWLAENPKTLKPVTLDDVFFSDTRKVR